MPPSPSKASQPPICTHTQLTLNVPPTPSLKYKQPTKKALTEAAGQKWNPRAPHQEDPGTFPAPLVFTDDELFHDPKQPGQTVQEWCDLRSRNDVTPERNNIYVAAPPQIDPEASFIGAWTDPQRSGPGRKSRHPDPADSLAPPRMADIMTYIAAFYHPLPVKALATPLTFTTWSPVTSTSTPRYIALNTARESVRIRARAPKDRAFARQLNLDDVFDVAISALPDDAFALLMLVEHDLYEDADDDFCCGRAYGGSRVAVVSSARYHPCRDAVERVQRGHAWPGSHCAGYVGGMGVGGDGNGGGRKGKRGRRGSTGHETLPPPPDLALPSPMQRAIAAHNALTTPRHDATSPYPAPPPQDHLAGLWLSRVCKTASHELGHCFGIGHCVYYACVMQGTASLAEDARQPPYLCPVDAEKVCRATGVGGEERLRALGEACAREEFARVRMFAALGGWIGGVSRREGGVKGGGVLG